MGLWLITRGFILPFVRVLNEFLFLPLFVKGGINVYQYGGLGSFSHMSYWV